MALLGYATRVDVELIYGKSNVQQWADVNNLEVASEIEARINYMLELSENKINDRLREGPYVIPFVVPTPFIIKDITARQTGFLLYDGRGIVDAEDEEEGIDNLNPHRKEVEKTIVSILGYKQKLDLALQSVTFPQAVSIT